MADNEGGLSPFASRFAGGKAERSSGDGEPAADDGELVAPGDIYATVAGQRLALSIEFIRKDGSSFTMPYACLPLLWWTPPGTLVIEYPGFFSVRLRGKELYELHRRIRDRRLAWLREFDERQAVALSSAVTSIEIVYAYPSREAGEGET